MSAETALFQLFPLLDPATEAALRSSIERHGVLVPVAVDQHGRLLDGYHRSRIADELGVTYERRVHEVRDDDHARELARTLNVLRRHLDPDQRRDLVAELRAQGHSLRAIGGALGVSHTQVRSDLESTGKSFPVDQPERIIGRDGKSRPATMPARAFQRGDIVADDHGDARSVHRVESHGDDIVLFDDNGDAIVAHASQELRVGEEPSQRQPQLTVVRPPVTKPDLGGGISHPARYSSELLPIFAAAVPVSQYPRVLDPFAGTGRIHELENETVGVELEPEWAELHPGTEVGTALDLKYADGSFDAVVTSPTYGNRLADHHNAADPHLRRSYTHDLGRKLSTDNSGAMQWGADYRKFHEQAWEEAWRVLRPGGRLVLNIKDHIRGGRRQLVTAWHINTMFRLGFELAWAEDVPTPNLRQGENSELRLPEQVWVLDKPEARR